MYKEMKNYYIIEEFEKLGIIAVYTKKNLGNMSDYCESADNQEGNRKNLLNQLELSDREVVMAHQTHTNNIKIIDKHVTNYVYNGIDGFITDRKDVALFTFYADCLPVFAYDMKNHVIGVAHSGWPGTYKEMLKSLIDSMKERFHSEPENIILGLGIGIAKKDYEVDKDFYEKFQEKFDKEIIESSFSYCEEKEKYYFDNIMFNKITALRMGILEENIITADESTMEEKFHSYRRDNKNSGRATAMIAFK